MKTNQGKIKNYVNQEGDLQDGMHKNKASAMVKFP